MINPFRRSADRVRAEAEKLAANPRLVDIDPMDLVRAGDIERLTEVARRTEELRAHQREADELQRRADALDGAVTGHEEAERAQASLVASTAARLEASRTALTAAVKAADVAMAKLHAAAEGHDALVCQSSAEFRAAGLVDRYADGDAVVEFSTGGTPASGLLIAGKVWTRLDPRVVLKRSLYAALRARYGDHDVEVTRLRLTTPVGQLDRHTAGLLADAAVPKPPKPRTSVWGQIMGESGPARQQLLGSTQPAPADEDATDRKRRLYEEDEGARVLAKRRAAIVKEKGQAYLDKLDEVNAGRLPVSELKQS